MTLRAVSPYELTNIPTTINNNLTVTGAITENGYNVVSQTDVGTAPNQLPLNQYLGTMAFQSMESVIIKPQASAVPNDPTDMVFELTSNTSLKIKVMGSDGTVRSATLTLA